MPAALGSTASPLALVPGDERALEDLAAQLRSFASGAAEAAARLRDIQAGSWVGEAADAFREQIGDLPRRLERGADAFFAAQGALDAHADTLREARQVAARAVDHWAEGERATARWEAEVREHHRAAQSAAMDAALTGLPATPVGPGPSSVDPGADDRALATRPLEGARDTVDGSARAAVRVLQDAAEAAPDEPSWLSRAADQVGEFFTGAGEATRDMAVFAWKVSPTYALIDPEGFYEHGRGLVEGLVYGVQNPVEFAKAVVDWETWKENPARALGRLVPDLLLTLATAGAGAASRGARGLDAAGDLSRARRAEDVPTPAVRDAPSRPQASSTFDDVDRRALLDYTTPLPDSSGVPPYKRMNEALRSGSIPADLQPRIDAVSEALGKLPPHEGVVFRGTYLPPEVLSRYQPGRTVVEAGFTSSTMRPEAAFPGNVRFVMESRTGRGVAPHSAVPDEAEILFDRGTPFRVLDRGVDDDTGKTVITMVEEPGR